MVLVSGLTGFPPLNLTVLKWPNSDTPALGIYRSFVSANLSNTDGSNVPQCRQRHIELQQAQTSQPDPPKPSRRTGEKLHRCIMLSFSGHNHSDKRTP